MCLTEGLKDAVIVPSLISLSTTACSVVCSRCPAKSLVVGSGCWANSHGNIFIRGRQRSPCFTEHSGLVNILRPGNRLLLSFLCHSFRPEVVGNSTCSSSLWATSVSLGFRMGRHFNSAQKFKANPEWIWACHVPCPSTLDSVSDIRLECTLESEHSRRTVDQFVSFGELFSQSIRECLVWSSPSS